MSAIMIHGLARRQCPAARRSELPGITAIFFIDHRTFLQNSIFVGKPKSPEQIKQSIGVFFCDDESAVVCFCEQISCRFIQTAALAVKFFKFLLVDNSSVYHLFTKILPFNR